MTPWHSLLWPRFSLYFFTQRILETRYEGSSRHMGALLSCKLNQCDTTQWYPHKMVAVTLSVKLRTITDCTILRFSNSIKEQSRKYISNSMDVFLLFGAFVCGSECKRHMCHLIIKVDLFYFPGIWHVRTSSESDKRHQERGVWTPGEHRRHWRCWASDREAKIQGWLKKNLTVYIDPESSFFIVLWEYWSMYIYHCFFSPLSWVK